MRTLLLRNYNTLLRTNYERLGFGIKTFTYLG
jgi:hypothetical protein